jgi:uncharacterized protein YbbC (DUF1343 family)
MLFDPMRFCWKTWGADESGRSLTQQMVYPGTGIIEGTNVNIKGPVEPPFVRFGAPWIVAAQLAAYLNARKIPGVTFMAISYTPSGEEPYPYQGERVERVEIIDDAYSRAWCSSVLCATPTRV